MTEAVIVSTARTPIGRAFRGALNDTHGAALGAHVIAATSTRNMDVIRSLAPDVLFDYTQEDFAERGQRYDVFFDVAANRRLGDCLRVL
ncbi:MAG TPA: hypothetical protein VGQ23_00350, partial [Burkholderiaceae bacterium]|nr:hypothetical protein [Burkholderiaceae bacterium]